MNTVTELGKMANDFYDLKQKRVAEIVKLLRDGNVLSQADEIYYMSQDILYIGYKRGGHATFYVHHYLPSEKWPEFQKIIEKDLIRREIGWRPHETKILNKSQSKIWKQKIYDEYLSPNMPNRRHGQEKIKRVEEQRKLLLSVLLIE